MNIPASRANGTNHSQSVPDSPPRRLIVTVSVVIFAVRNWSLWVLVREGPWGPPLRIVRGSESVADAVDSAVEALLMWPVRASMLQLKAGWQEQQVKVWGSSEQGAAVTLIHSVLVRAHRDELLPNLQQQSIPSLRVHWTPVMEIESGRYMIDAEVRPVLQAALHTLRSQVQRDPEIVLSYLADFGKQPDHAGDKSQHKERWSLENDDRAGESSEAHSFTLLKEPPTGDGILTLAEATLLYRAFFPPDEQIDLSNLRRRFLSTNNLEPLDEERPVRGREQDWRRVSRAYCYHGSKVAEQMK